MEYCTYDDFKQLDIRVGTIKEVTPVPDTDKLLVCQVDVGETDKMGAPVLRQIVSGIREYVPDYESLIDRQLLYVINLEPRTIRGVTSHGMLLAVGDGAPTFLIPESPVEPGSAVR